MKKVIEMTTNKATKKPTKKKKSMKMYKLVYTGTQNDRLVFSDTYLFKSFEKAVERLENEFAKKHFENPISYEKEVNRTKNDEFARAKIVFKKSVYSIKIEKAWFMDE